MSARIYLDWNASAPLRGQARAAMEAALDLAGNPSSLHREGRAAKQVIEKAREEVASLVGAHPRQVVFTAGGSEANALALTPMIQVGDDKAPRDRLLMSAIEHPSVRSGGFFEAELIDELPVLDRGTVDLNALEVWLHSNSRALVTLMLANNETGVVQPVVRAADMVHAAGGLLHVDAVQGPGRLPVDMAALGADLLTLSAHKIGGPKGVGALILRDGLHLPHPPIRGGGQERGLRAGTENVAGIAGFGAAARAAQESLSAEAAHCRALRERLETGLRAVAADTVIFAQEADRLPNTTLFAVPGLKAETALIALDLDGIAVSSGSACSSGKVEPSHVLAAMGVPPDLARGAIRVSLGFTNTKDEIERFLSAWAKVVHALYKNREIAA